MLIIARYMSITVTLKIFDIRLGNISYSNKYATFSILEELLIA
ncbi:MAG: hypothetical protein QW551_00870 [Desulfurococcaceae archaeon]